MQETELTGSCLCGGVSYAVSGNLGVFQYCHCSRCRKFSGSAFAANLLVAPEHFRWLSGEALVSRFEYPGARHFATCFCSKCGGALPWLAQSGKSVVIPAGTLDADPGIRPSQNLFWSSRAPWYEEPQSLPRYEALPTGRR